MMNARRSQLLKIIFALFAVNSLTLFLYFSLHHHQPHQRNSSGYLKPPPSADVLPGRHYLKPWPILPSYLPWNQNPNVTFRSCEAYFGNGFTRRVDVLRSAVGSPAPGWFRCLYSETLRSSVCEGGSIRMVPERVRMSVGGEAIEAVIGRGEEEELPDFEYGAFEVLGVEKKRRRLVGREFLDMYVPQNDIGKHTMRGLIGSIRVVNEKEFICDQTVLEETWKALFSSVRYAKNFSGPVCFRHAVFVPLGYETPLFKGLSEEIDCRGASAHDLWKKPDNKKIARLSEFGEMIRAAFDFPVNRHSAEKPASGHNVLFVRREDYLAHPRHAGKVESRLSNEQEVFDALQIWANNHLECKVNLVNGLFAHMPLKEQVRSIQEASFIVGAHGAGLTHIVSATPQTVILEIISSYFRRPHFQLIAQWKGLEYHAINLEGSHVRPDVVIDRLNRIMKSLGC
ncbi:hypothetical protein K2173_015549 [Erythroxylum novogranatense]|uniref:Glycosyltransferase 61 catalytic domain-containing protein n=1 Tax=Erythroxylum novogranatense TaxID=1862640 RepID=A0AAV8SRX6_9ROSI|nr:hypothetical protein K2173_015549 [Erythroxylum novogranatense]